MGYADALVRLLRPLGFYSFDAGSFSLAELQALGSALDALDVSMQQGQRETLVATAQGEGLDCWMSLFRGSAAYAGVEARRAAIAAFLRIGGDSFTLSALRGCLAACGVACQLDETGQVNRVTVSFPGIMGEPEGFAQARAVIEDILPCQLEITYVFRYCTWGETMAYGLRWADVAAMTWRDWRHYTRAESGMD